MLWAKTERDILQRDEAFQQQAAPARRTTEERDSTTTSALRRRSATLPLLCGAVLLE